MAESKPARAAASTRLETSPTGAQADDTGIPASSTAAQLRELQRENAALRAALREAGVHGDAGRPAPTRPSFGLSEGERAELEERGAATNAFTGEPMTAVGEGVDTSNPEAQARAEREERRRAGGEPVAPGNDTAAAAEIRRDSAK